MLDFNAPGNTLKKDRMKQKVLENREMFSWMKSDVRIMKAKTQPFKIWAPNCVISSGVATDNDFHAQDD